VLTDADSAIVARLTACHRGACPQDRFHRWANDWGVPADVKVRALDWGDETARSALLHEWPEGFTAIVGADVTYARLALARRSPTHMPARALRRYDFRLIEPLLDAAARLASAREPCQLVLVHECRPWARGLHDERFGSTTRHDFLLSAARARGFHLVEATVSQGACGPLRTFRFERTPIAAEEPPVPV
jgi:hypothetical protein